VRAKATIIEAPKEKGARAGLRARIDSGPHAGAVFVLDEGDYRPRLAVGRMVWVTFEPDDQFARPDREGCTCGNAYGLDVGAHTGKPGVFCDYCVYGKPGDDGYREPQKADATLFDPADVHEVLEAACQFFECSAAADADSSSMAGALQRACGAVHDLEAMADELVKTVDANHAAGNVAAPSTFMALGYFGRALEQWRKAYRGAR
jgi:hypothetical protein